MSLLIIENKNYKMNEIYDKLIEVFPKRTIKISYSDRYNITGISLDLTMTDGEIKKIDDFALLYFFKAVQCYLRNIIDFVYVLRRNFENIELNYGLESLGTFLKKMECLQRLKCIFRQENQFANNEKILNLCEGLNKLINLREIDLDFSGWSFSFEALGFCGKALGCLPFLSKISMNFSSTNVTCEMIYGFNDHFSKAKIENYGLAYKYNKFRETSLRKLMKNIKINFLELKCLNLDLGDNCLRKESIMYCIRKCLKENFCPKIEFLDLNFSSNETKPKNYLTIETSYEILKQDFDKLSLIKSLKNLKFLKLNLQNNQILVEDFLLFTRFFRFLSNLSKTLQIFLDFRGNQQIYDNILLLKLFESMSTTINESLYELTLKFDRIEINSSNQSKIREFTNLAEFSLETETLTFFGKNPIKNNNPNGLCLILNKMPNLKKLHLEIPFFEYNHNFFSELIDIFNSNLKNLEFLKLRLNYIYLFHSQIDSLIESIRGMKRLKFMDLILLLSFDVKQPIELMDDAEFENITFMYESLPYMIENLKELIKLNVFNVVNGVTIRNPIEFRQAKEIMLKCLEKRKKMLFVDFGEEKTSKINKKFVERFFFIGRTVDLELRSVFKRKDIINEIFEKFL